MRSVGCPIAKTIAVALLCGCGPDDVEIAEHDEVCGQPGPVRILELDPDRALSGVEQVSHDDGRRVLRVGILDLTPDWEGGPVAESFEIWNVGSCGESPALAEDDLAGFRAFFHWPDLLFACDYEIGAFEIVDPTGARPRNLVFETDNCQAHETAWGLVGFSPIDEDLGALVLWPFPADPWTETSTPQVLFDTVRMRSDPSHGGGDTLAVFDDEVFALSADAELQRLSLIDGTVVTEATGVYEFEVSADRRWLIWQDTTITGGDDEWPAGPVYLRDREAQTTTHLADVALAGAVPRALSFTAQGVVRLQLGYLYQEPERIYRLEDLVSVELPLGVTTHSALPDGRLLIGDAFNQGRFGSLDPATGATTPLFDDTATVDILDDHIEFLQDVNCCVGLDERAQGPLWSVTFDGNRELIAHESTDHYRYLADDRLLTRVDIDDRWRGDLIVVDPNDLIERRVDDHVVIQPRLDDDDTIVYGVDDDDRTGVWLARLAPR